MPYESYVSKRSKKIPTDSYFFLARHLAKFMMSNLCGLVRTKNMSTENMSNSCGLVRTKNMSNSRDFSTDDSKSKMVNAMR